MHYNISKMYQTNPRDRRGSSSPSDDDNGGGKRNSSEYRKHPYHKSTWERYPSISISRKSSDEPKDAQGNMKKVKSINEKMDELKEKVKKNDSVGRADMKRSKGNVSIRTVLENVFQKSSTSVYYRVRKISLPWLIKQIARFCVFWDFALYFTIVATLSMTSFSAFFSFYDKALWDWIVIADCIFTADTILRLSAEIWRFHNRGTILVFTAPYTMLQFLLDVISIIPLQQFYYWFQGSSELEDLSMIGYFRLNRFLRLSRCKTFFDMLQREGMVNEKLLFIFIFSNYYLGFIYFTACLLVSCIGVQPMDYLLYNDLEKLDESYLKDFQQTKPGYGSTPWDIFVITFNFMTAVITTVGYGDVVPNNELEMSICIICMLFGAIFLSGYYGSEMCNFLLELDGARFDLFYRLIQIREYLRTMRTLPFFNAKVEEYYNCLWTYREGVYDVSFMRKLPQTFHEELLLDICLEMFDKSHLFHNLDPAFLRAIAKTATVSLYNSNMILCRTGSYSGRMYYILQGECQAMSKLNPANPSAIIRAGSIIGEVNLFFSFPYTTTVETRTCCQFIMLTKQSLVDVLAQFPVETEILRSRNLGKLRDLYDTHQAYGVDPICWVKARTDMENPSRPNADSLRRNMRWGNGLNKEVLEDVVDDSEKIMIFETPCDDQSVMKNHLLPYISCTVPAILSTKINWIRRWNFFIVCVALYFAFFGPYCLAFSESTKLEFYICKILYFDRFFISILFIVDLLVEILGACPVVGIYYKFWDGLGVVRHSSTFYLDIIAAIPLDLWTTNPQDWLHIFGTGFKILKLWKVNRFLRYLDNVYPLQLFWLRVMRTIICLLYGIHFISCILYLTACPFDTNSQKIQCKQISWLASYEIRSKLEIKPNEEVPVKIRTNTLGYGAPYMYSFFYATATITSAGFGDFNPQDRMEMICAIGFQLAGFFLVGYYTSILTSALSCLVRSKLALQQQLVSMYQFMDHYHLRQHLKDRVVEYYVLQHQLRGGVALDAGTHIMYDAPAYLRDDVLYLEVFELLDGVPVFSKVEDKVIIKLSNVMKLILIPPNTTFVQVGEVRRILYLIKNGSMGIFELGSDKPVSVLEASTHFGIRDLLFGEPSHYVIKSLSYVSLYEIKRHDFEDALQYEEDFWDLVKSEKMRIKQVIHEMTLIYAAMGTKAVVGDRATSIPSWIEVPPRVSASEKWVMGHSGAKKIMKINMMNNELDSLYNNFPRLRFMKYFLLRKTVHPVGCFSKVWNCTMSLVCCFTVVSLTLETFCYTRMPWFRAIQFLLDIFNYVDIYLKMHWSYYNPHNQMLVTHPLKTAIHYTLHGSLIMDVAICAPMELLMWVAGGTNFLGYGEGASWYSKLRWIRLFQFKRIPILFKILRNVFNNRTFLLFTLYIIITLFVCTMVSTVALFIACPWEANDWKEGDEYRIPLCSKDGWVGLKFSDIETNPAVLSGFFRRWVLGLYYVSQVFLVIGFGDIIVLDRNDICLLIFMCIFGFLFMRSTVADMTAAEVDSDQARTEFLEHITVLDLVLRRERVSKRLISSVMSYLRTTWTRSRGLQSRELFSELHPVLESELYGNIVTEKLMKVPIFKTFPLTLLRCIFRYMKTLYINRGERLMRFGNFEYEMYIIITGKVYITDQHLNYICSLGAGDSFGETSMIYGTGRRHNAIAACYTEVYSLSSHHFEKFLSHYPDSKNEMVKNMSSVKQDYFETVIEKKMRNAENLTEDQKCKMLATFAERTALIKDIIAHKEDFEQSGLDPATVARRNMLFGVGCHDENLPLIYFAVKSMRKMKCYPVLHPNCWLYTKWAMFIGWLCVITPAIAVYEVCFSRNFISEGVNTVDSSNYQASRLVHTISEVFEFILLINILFTFFVAFEIKNGVFNKTPRCIVMRYLTAADGFVFDLVACIPFIVEKTLDALNLEFADFDSNIEAVFEGLYLLRCLRLYKYYQSQQSKSDELSFSTFRMQICMSLTSFCLMAHMTACLFYWISPCTRPDLRNPTVHFSNLCPPPTEGLDQAGWTTQYVSDKGIETNKERLDAWRWWFRSIYWVVTTISTTGFGDIVPVTINEMIAVVICMFWGAFILTMILSQFTSGMASLTQSEREYVYEANLLVKHLKNIGLSEIRQSQVMMYFRESWQSCRGVPYHDTWKKLPLTMQIEVAYALFGNTLMQVSLFKDYKERIFIRQLCIRVKHSLYIPGSYIQKAGDPGSTLFVVYKGVVSATLMQSNNEPELKGIYKQGDAFGRFAALFHDGIYKQSYRAETMVEILEVKRKDIVHLAKKFPHFKRKLYDFITTKYYPKGANVNIFYRKRRKADKEINKAEQILKK